ncbi:MAG: hypothetical protein ACLF0G_15605 [Candidatus Brocadiia bacterium]
MSPVHGIPGFFDYEASVVVREPQAAGEGWWAGAPGAFYDAEDDCFYLTYRYRRPRGEEPDRGAETRLAKSEDGIEFEDLAVLPKARFDSPSIERGALHRADDGTWLWYVSYVDGEDGRWRIDLLDASRPDAFDPADRRPLFLAPELGVEGVKDPWVLRAGPVWYMLISYATRPAAEASDDEMHGSADIYNTGLTRSCSALATSLDGRRWQWQGDIMHPVREGAWDSYATRLGCLLCHPGGWLGFYDGSASVEGNYEERTGLAVSGDLFLWRSLTPGGPALASPHASGSLRYVDVVSDGVERFFYFESARPDGSHELRVVWHPEAEATVEEERPDGQL